jgi:hypothetical protein
VLAKELLAMNGVAEGFGPAGARNREGASPISGGETGLDI